MSELKRTVLYDAHVVAGATMVDFGGWDMPIQYPSGIIAEHLYCRRHCGIFDVSHMGRLLVDGEERLAFLQHVLTNNAAALQLNESQYTIIADEKGCAIDDAYLYRFEEARYLLVINAGNIEKDCAYLYEQAKHFKVRLTDISKTWAAIAVQGPESEQILLKLSGGKALLAKNVKNELNTLELDGRLTRIGKTGYTGEPIGFEVYCKSEDAVYFWNRLIELGAKPVALGARDTLRMETALPLYGHEMGECQLGGEIPIFSVAQARFVVSFAEEKGDFVGKQALLRQSEAAAKIKQGDFSAMEDLPYRTRPICLVGKGVLRAHCEVFDHETGEKLGYVTSGTMIPYYECEEHDGVVTQSEKTGKRSIGLAYLKSNVVSGQKVDVDIRGKRVAAAVVVRHMKSNTTPYAFPVLYQEEK